MIKGMLAPYADRICNLDNYETVDLESNLGLREFVIEGVGKFNLTSNANNRLHSGQVLDVYFMFQTAEPIEAPRVYYFALHGRKFFIPYTFTSDNNFSQERFDLMSRLFLKYVGEYFDNEEPSLQFLSEARLSY